MKKIIFLTVFSFLLPSTLLFAQTSDLSTYQGRRTAVVDAIQSHTPGGSGKHGLPRALAKLERNPNDAEALAYIVSSTNPRQQTMFDFPGLALALCRYWDSFSPEQRKSLQTALERLAKSDKNEGEGFLGHGTENHALISWAPAVLFCELFPDAQWANGMNSNELHTHLKEWLRTTFKNYYERSYTEYLSTTYQAALLIPIEILYKYTKDPEMRDIAEAYLLYHWSLLALNTFDGEIIAPFGRQNQQQNHLQEAKIHFWGDLTAFSYYTWVLFGWGEATNNMNFSHFLDYNEGTFAIYAAMSETIPNNVFFELAANKDPITVRTSASTFGPYGRGVPKMMLRKIYRTGQYAIGTGNFRWVPGGDYADHDTCGFAITWNSNRQFNYLNCTHPYWYSEGTDITRNAEMWNQGSVSPFMQTAQHENTAIALFDIPNEDPWKGKPTEQKWAWRDKRGDDLIKRGMIRFPKSVDFAEDKENGWIFLRAAKTYIAIKPLQSYYIERTSRDISLVGFNIIKSDHAKTGFIFEVGTEAEYRDFGAFRRKIPTNKVDVNWDTMTVTYTNSREDTIQIKYVSGLPIAPVPAADRPNHWNRIGAEGLAESIPEVSINGKPEVSVADWSLIDSPVITMKGSVLNIDDGRNKIRVDWTGDLPKITKTEPRVFRREN